MSDLANLKAQLDEAHEEIRQLRQLLQPPERAFPIEWKLTPLDAKILWALVDHPQARTELIYARIYRADDTPCESIITSRICTIRQKLKPYGIKIQTIWAVGYALEPEVREKLKRGEYSHV